jgi:hypothetical protein
MKRDGKALLVGLVIVLAVVVGVGLFIYVPQWQVASKQKSFEGRIGMTSALRRAVRDAHDRTKQWPKNVDEVRGEAALATVDKGMLGRVRYDLVRVDEKGRGVYAYSLDGRKEEIVVPPKSMDQSAPMAAGMSQ